MSSSIALLAALIHATFSLASAAPPTNWPPSVHSFCESSWPDQDATTRADAEMCARYWLKRYVYGNASRESIGFSTQLPEDWLDTGHYNGLEVETRLTAEHFRGMIRHIDNAMPTDPFAIRIAEQAKAYFEGAIESRFTLRGISSAPVSSIAPQLAKILGGKRIAPEELICLTPVTLWKLHNAVYARHGAMLYHPDLETFFYGKRSAELKRPMYTSLLPRRPDQEFSEDALTTIDRDNLQLLVQVRALDAQTRCEAADTWGIASLY